MKNINKFLERKILKFKGNIYFSLKKCQIFADKIKMDTKLRLLFNSIIQKDKSLLQEKKKKMFKSKLLTKIARSGARQHMSLLWKFPDTFITGS